MTTKSRPFRAVGLSSGARGVARRSPDGREVRCECGNLLARVVANGVELKCRRCKRTVLIPLDGEAETASE
jgi:phage FluMu protein Com